MKQFYRPEDVNYVLGVARNAHIVYASMEIALHDDMKTYSGGLGVLAGDTLHSAADMCVPVVGLTLLYRKGYFAQALRDRWQVELEEPWDVDKFTVSLPEYRVSLQIEGRNVWVQPSMGIIVGHNQKHLVPVFFLDTDLPENDPVDRGITHQLYGGDNRWRLKQEAVLGIAGKRIIRKIGLRNVNTFHMNEGHAALAPLEDVFYLSKYYSFNRPAIERLVRSAHVFTTHTPVPAGHDRFDHQLMREVLGSDDFAWDSLHLGGVTECNMTRLALNLSRFSNAVAKRHGEVSRRMFPGYKIDSITNGVHLPSWMSPHIQGLLDKYLPSWREEPAILERCYEVIDHEAVWQAHLAAKRELIDFVKQRTGVELSMDCLTVGFARRFATYKRADLMFTDVDMLRSIAGGNKMQFVFAGEAHPRDEEGKRIIQRVLNMADVLRGDINIVFIEDYCMEVARLMVAGCDLWQNNPIPPKEASGTSGMKASANAVPNLSTLDGWWIEGITRDPWAGWIIDHRSDGKDHLSLYERYGHIIRVFYDRPERYKEHMAHSLSLAAYFNTHRMVQEYLDKSWSLQLF